MNNEEIMKKSIEEQIKTNYKVPFWKKAHDFLEVFLVFVLIVFLLLAFIFILITLIENPVSLAILCGTILLIIIWMTR